MSEQYRTEFGQGFELHPNQHVYWGEVVTLYPVSGAGDDAITLDKKTARAIGEALLRFVGDGK